MKVIAHLQVEKITKIQWLNFGPQYSKVRGIQILPFREYCTHLGLTVTLKAHAVPSSEPISIQSMESQDITHQPPTDWVAITTWPAHVLFLCLFVWNFSSHSRTFYSNGDVTGFFSVPHLLWHGASIYNGHLRGPETLAPIAKRLTVQGVSTCFNDLGLSQLRMHFGRDEKHDSVKRSFKQELW